jgi:hypothetical protein
MDLPSQGAELGPGTVTVDATRAVTYYAPEDLKVVVAIAPSYPVPHAQHTRTLLVACVATDWDCLLRFGRVVRSHGNLGVTEYGMSLFW